MKVEMIPGKKANRFIEWFTFSDESIDGKSKTNKRDYMNAMMLSPINSEMLKTLLNNALITKINDREMFMKGIDYSYYYEEDN